VVFVHGELGAFGPLEYVAAWLAGVRRVKAIHHLTPSSVPPAVKITSIKTTLKRLIGYRTRYLIARTFTAALTEQAICVSDAVRTLLVAENKYPASKVFVIQNGVDLARFAPDQEARTRCRAELGVGGEVVLVSASRLTPIKGYDVLVRALALLVSKQYTFKWIVVGEGRLQRQIRDQVDSLGLTDSTIFLGFQHDIRPFLNAADVFLLTSYLEGLPLTILEAMACGLPCVVTDVGGNAEAVRHGKEGLVIRPGDAAGVSEALAYLFENPRERMEMSRSARLRTCATFDVNRQMPKLVSTLLHRRGRCWTGQESSYGGGVFLDEKRKVVPPCGARGGLS
jgi:glycosyltransferase involved in cell wall biosynthesis